MQKNLRGAGDDSPSPLRWGDESPNFRERLNSLRKKDRSITDAKDEADVLHTAALDMTSNIVQRLLQDCVFKNSKVKKPNPFDPEASQTTSGGGAKHLKKGSKDVSLAKKSKIDKLIERDLERGPQFRR